MNGELIALSPLEGEAGFGLPSGTVRLRVSEAADPQIVVFTNDSAGYTVDEVKDG